MLTQDCITAIMSTVGARVPTVWGYSSAGRALDWQSRGQRFDPAYLHQEKTTALAVVFLFAGGLRVDRHCAAMRGSLRSADRRGARPEGVSRLSPPTKRTSKTDVLFSLSFQCRINSKTDNFLHLPTRKVSNFQLQVISTS